MVSRLARCLVNAPGAVQPLATRGSTAAAESGTGRWRRAIIRVNLGCFTIVRQVKFDSAKKQMESMEMEVMEARLIRASELNGEMEEDDGGETHTHAHTHTHTRL